MPEHPLARDLILRFEMHHALDSDFRGVMSHWLIDVIHAVEDPAAPYGLREDKVGRIDIVEVTLGRPDTYTALDELSTDLARVADALIDPRTGEVVEELEERLELIGSTMLVLNEVELSPGWRGLGLGPLLAGEALATLSRGAQLAATLPGSIPELPGSATPDSPTSPDSPDGPDGVPPRSAEDEAAVTAKLGRVWARIGFEHFRDGVWFVDLAMGHLYQGLAAQRERFGLENDARYE